MYWFSDKSVAVLCFYHEPAQHKHKKHTNTHTPTSTSSSVTTENHNQGSVFEKRDGGSHGTRRLKIVLFSVFYSPSHTLPVGSVIYASTVYIFLFNCHERTFTRIIGLQKNRLTLLSQPAYLNIVIKI